MAEERLEGEKSEEPSSRRIEEFRNRGEVAFSRELNSILLLAALSFCLLLSITYTINIIANFLEWITSLDYTKMYNSDGFALISKKILSVFLRAVAPTFLTSFVVSILVTVSQIGVIFAGEVISLKWDRLNPVEGFKRLFSIRSLVETAKGILKSIILMVSVYLFVRNQLKIFVNFLYADANSSLYHGNVFLAKLALTIILALAVVALIDLIYQKLSYRNRLMMTKQEAKQELKEHDGDPLVRQRIRSVQRELANRRTIQEVKNADVIVSNPTHISVALKYDRIKMISPIVIAKGVDFLALKMREEAKNEGVPVVENVPLARTLYKTVKVGETVPSSLYQVVAEVLAFVYRLKERA